MHLQKFRVATLLAMVLLVAVGAYAQTGQTGAIEGTVKQAGTALPGVTVEVRSSALQGVRTGVTDGGGNFRFTLLPTGYYTVTATLSGFNTVTQNSVKVELNHTVSLDVVMSPSASATITVTGAAPVVDVTSNVQGANITSETMQSLPLGRNFVAAAQIAPGTNADARGTTVYGSSGLENSYVIDGLNTTGIGFGAQVKLVNTDFISEVEALTGGLPAEYGRMTGGAINAVTKSGSNEFHGDVFGYDSGGSLNSDNTNASKLPTSSTTVASINRQYDAGVDLGGYIMKDRLWFFGAYDRVNETDLSTRINSPLLVSGFPTIGVGTGLTSKLGRDLYAGKLSLALTSSHLINLSVLGDPSSNAGAIFAIAGEPSTYTGVNKIGSNDFVGRYSGVFGTNWNVNATAGRHHELNTLTGPGSTIPLIIDRTQVPSVRFGGFGLFTNQDYKRDTGKLDVSAFFGSHQFKVGGDLEDQTAVNANTESGGASLQKRCSVAVVNNVCPANGLVYYTHEAYLDDRHAGFNANDPTTFAAALVNPLASAPKDKNKSLYIQDSWKVLTNLTLNLGYRWEEQQVGSRDGTNAIDLKHDTAPRIGAIWDPMNNGRSKVYANYGRFYEAIPMDINLRAFGGELTIDVNNQDPKATDFTPDPLTPALKGTARYRLLGGSALLEPVDPNLKGQYIDEYLLGGDYEIASNLAVGIKYTYRNLGNVIEDFLIGSTGEYLIANPGVGTGATGTTFLGDVVQYGKAQRKYKGIEVHAEKRFSNNYQFFTSYVWSQLKGNYDGTFQASTGQADPNINSAFDYADFLVNNNGFLSNDRTHVVKFYGSYTLSNGFAKGLDVGVGAHWESGVPLTAQGYSVTYRNFEYYLTTRGALGRGPSDYEADIHAGFPIPVGGSHVSLLLDVFNIFNRQSATNLDQRYNQSGDPACTGIPYKPPVNNVPQPASPSNLCNTDGGLLNIAGTTKVFLPLTNLTPSNPSFLKAGTTFTGVRSIRFGARWTF